MRVRIEEKEARFHAIFREHYHLWNHFIYSVQKVIESFIEKSKQEVYRREPEREILNRIGEKLEERLDVLLKYLEEILPEMLNKIRINPSIIKTQGEQFEKMGVLSRACDMEKKGESFKIEILDHYMLAYSMPAVIVGNVDIKSLWLCQENSLFIAYTSKETNPSEETKKKVMALRTLRIFRENGSISFLARKLFKSDIVLSEWFELLDERVNILSEYLLKTIPKALKEINVSIESIKAEARAFEESNKHIPNCEMIEIDESLRIECSNVMSLVFNVALEIFTRPEINTIWISTLNDKLYAFTAKKKELSDEEKEKLMEMWKEALKREGKEEKKVETLTGISEKKVTEETKKPSETSVTSKVDTKITGTAKKEILPKYLTSLKISRKSIIAEGRRLELNGFKEENVEIQTFFDSQRIENVDWKFLIFHAPLLFFPDRIVNSIWISSIEKCLYTSPDKKINDETKRNIILMWNSLRCDEVLQFPQENQINAGLKLVFDVPPEHKAFLDRIVTKLSEIMKIFHENYFIWQRFEGELTQQIVKFGRNFPKNTNAEKIEWLKALEKRYDLLINYLRLTLPPYLTSIGMTQEAVKRVESNLQPFLTLNLDTPIPEWEEVNLCRKFVLDPVDLVTPLFSISLLILGEADINSIWIDHETKILYTSPIDDLSFEGKNEIMENWEKDKEKLAINLLQLRDELEEAEKSRSCSEEDEFSLEIVDLICPICMQQYEIKEKYPITFVPCGHEACQKCFMKLAQEKDSCPKCQSLIALGIVSMALIGTLKALLRQKAAKERENRSSSLAQSCETSTESSEQQKVSENEAENGEVKLKKLDQSKLRLTGLPNGWTVKIILEKLFNNGKTIEKDDGRLIISTRNSGRFLECVAHFVSEDAGRNAYLFCERAFATGDLFEAKVNFLEVETDSDHEIEDEQNVAKNKKPSSSNNFIAKANPPDKKRIFISGLPKDFTESDVIEKIVGGRDRLGNEENKSIILRPTCLGQNCIVSLKNEAISKKCISNWNSQALNDRRLIVEYLGQCDRDFSQNYSQDINAPTKKKGMKRIIPHPFNEIPFIVDFGKSYLAKNERYWGNICLELKANFQLGFVYFTSKTSAKKAKDCLIENTEESLSASILQIELIEIGFIEKQNENHVRTSLKNGDLRKREFGLGLIPRRWPAKPKMRELFISGIPIYFSFRGIVFNLLGGSASFDNYNEDVIFNRVPGPALNCLAAFRDEKQAEKIKAALSNRILEGTHRIFVETYGVTRRDFDINYGDFVEIGVE
ncbi:unnamed protein product, partial [Mesorhabditis belari]|uniref:RING-type domain-containing protein n=1 Tax=Mesorhabditis belari TaxID=2138241 RepID=A0AAF3F635_9BILA